MYSHAQSFANVVPFVDKQLFKLKALAHERTFTDWFDCVRPSQPFSCHVGTDGSSWVEVVLNSG